MQRPFNPRAGGSSPLAFTNSGPVAERLSGGLLNRDNVGSIPTGFTNSASLRIG